MFKSACDVMKMSISVSAILLFTGVLFEIIAQFLSLESIMPVILIYGGFLSICLGLVMILATLVAIMLPKVKQSLEDCQYSQPTS